MIQRTTSSFPKILGLSILVIGVAGGWGAWQIFGPASLSATSSAPAAADSAIPTDNNLVAQSGSSLNSQDLLGVVNTLDSITLDGSIFQDPAFQSLQDFTVTLVPQPVGRANPFAPVGGVSTPVTPKK